MSKDSNQSKEEKAISVLKDVNNKIKDAPIEENLPADDLPSSKEAAEQVKGSDADMDQSVGEEHQPDSKAAAKRAEASDADADN